MIMHGIFHENSKIDLENGMVLTLDKPLAHLLKEGTEVVLIYTSTQNDINNYDLTIEPR